MHPHPPSVERDWKPRFFTFWTGQALSRLGSQVVSFALIWWLTESTGSETALATASLMTLLPPVILGPLAGALVDRWSRRRIMVVSDTVIALFTALLALLYWSGVARPWHLYGIMLIRAVAGSFHGPSMMASTALMVPRDQLTRVAGMNQALNGALRIAAPPLGAIVLGALPMHFVASIDVLTAAFAVVPLLFISIPRPAVVRKPERAPALWRDTIDGLRYVVRYRELLFIVASCTVTNLFLGPAVSFIPLLVRNVFHGGAMELALVGSATGAGLIAGGLLMTAWRGFRRKLVTSAVGWIGVGIGAMAVLAIPDTGLYLFVASRLLVGIMVGVGSAPLEAWYQSRVAPDKQGRVFAVLGSIDQLTMPAGLALAGLLGGLVPLRLWWGLVGFQHALLGLAWLLLPIVRRAEETLRPSASPSRRSEGRPRSSRRSPP